MSETLIEQPLWFIDNLARVHVDGAATGGAFDLVELTGRRGDMPPLHVHHGADELFYVLEGEVSLHLPGQSVSLGVGQSFLAPRDVPHAYRIESEGARWLGGATPAGFAAFVREASEAAEEDDLPPSGRQHDIAALAAAAARQGIELLGPPGMLP